LAQNLVLKVLLDYQKSLQEMGQQTTREWEKVQQAITKISQKAEDGLFRDKIKTMEQLQAKAIAQNNEITNKRLQSAERAQQIESQALDKIHARALTQNDEIDRRSRQRIETATRLQQEAMARQMSMATQYQEELSRAGTNFNPASTSLGGAGTTISRSNVEETSSATARFTQVVQGANGAVTTYTGNLNRATGQTEILSRTTTQRLVPAMEQSTNVFSRFAQTLVHDISKMAEWGISGEIIFGTLKKIGDGVQYITEMDTALANIRMASGMTTEETNGLADAYNRLGKELGESTKVIADSAVDLYRQGLNTEEVNGRLAEYIKLSKVIGEDLQTTIEMGTAGTTAFGVGIKELGDIANTVGDATASSGKEVMTAIQKSASVAQTAGVSMRELAAMAGVVASTTRESGSIVGNALKSVLSKLSQVDELTGDVNKDFGKTLKRLQDVGITVSDSNGNLLSATQILKNVGSQWDTMSEKTQKYISSGFGIYQLNRFTALVKGMTGEYERMLTVESGAMGSTDKKYEQRSNTVEAANKRMKDSWENLYNNTINSGFLKSLYNAEAGIVDLIDKTNALGVALTALGTILLVKNIPAMISMIATLRSYRTIGITATLVTNGMAEAEALAATNAIIMNAALFGIVGVLGLAAAACFYFGKAQTEAFNKSIDFTGSLNKESESATDTMKSISDLANVTEFSTSQHERLRVAANELIKIYPSLSKVIDENKLSVKSLGDAYKHAWEEEYKLKLQDASRAELSARLAYTSANAESKTATSNLNQMGYEWLHPGEAQVKKDAASIVKARWDATSAALRDMQNQKFKTPDFYAGADFNPPSPNPNITTPDPNITTPDGGSKSTLSTTQDILAQYKSYQQAISDTVHELNILQSKNKLISEDDYPAQEKAQQSLIDQYKKQQEAIRQYGLQLHAAIDSGKYSGDELQKLKDELDKESESWWSLQDNIYDASKAITDFGTKAKEAAIKALDASDAAKGLKEEMSAIKDLSDAEKDSISSYYDAQIQAVEDEISALKEKNDQLDKAAKTQELLLNLQEAQTALANIQSEHDVRLYTGQGSTGWEWVSDPSKLADAQKSVDDATKALADEATKNAQDAAEKILSDKVKALEAEKKVETDAYNVRKDKFDAFQKTVEEMMSTHDTISKDSLNTFLGSLTDSEKESYGNRITELTKFIDDWNAKIEDMKTPSTVSGGGGTTSYDYSNGKSAFETEADKAQADANRQHYKETGQLTTGNKVAGAKASGGSVSAGSTYQVNEVGLEGFMSSHSGKDFFTPLTSGGTIITADQMRKSSQSASSGTTWNITVDKIVANNPTEFFSKLKTQANLQTALGV